jgi:purine-nucleoside phosphorylase
MSRVYDPQFRLAAREIGRRLGIELLEGVYIAVSGPSYETPAEIRAFRSLGADMVGMSTAPEAIAARQAGLAVLGISLITNAAAGVVDSSISHEEVLHAGEEAGQKMAILFNELLPRIDELIRAHTG